MLLTHRSALFPRKGINSLRGGVTFAPRPEWAWLRQMRNQLFFSYITDLSGTWESYRLFTAPINWRLESGDRVEANWMPQGERLVEPFEIASDIFIPEDTYHFTRYRLEVELAAKRRFKRSVELVVRYLLRWSIERIGGQSEPESFQFAEL